MPHKLIIIVEILPFKGEDAQRVSREFTDSSIKIIPNNHLKLISGPPRTISHSKNIHPVPLDPNHKMFSALIEQGSISFFPEQNSTSIVFYDNYCLLEQSKVAPVVALYVKHGWTHQVGTK